MTEFDPNNIPEQSDQPKDIEATRVLAMLAPDLLLPEDRDLLDSFGFSDSEFGDF